MSEPDINELLRQRRGYLESCRRFDEEHGEYREAGKPAPAEFCEAAMAARWTLRKCEHDIAKLREKERAGLVEIERAERIQQSECTGKRIAKRAINAGVNRR